MNRSTVLNPSTVLEKANKDEEVIISRAPFKVTMCSEINDS